MGKIIDRVRARAEAKQVRLMRQTRVWGMTLDDFLALDDSLETRAAFDMASFHDPSSLRWLERISTKRWEKGLQ